MFLFMILHKVVGFLLRRWKFSLFVGFYLFIWRQNFIVSLIQPSVNNLVELEKCPVCYGESACNSIHEINITPRDVRSFFSNLFGVKNVYFGHHKGRDVVLKKLAHDFELRAFDKYLCEISDLNFLCAKNADEKIENYKTNFRNLIEREISTDFHRDESTRLRLCPTLENLDKFFDKVYKNNGDVDRKVFIINLWTLVSVNPEPLILQIIPAEDGWPVPRLLGACGRVIVEEYVGPPLADYYENSWVQRARISASLLKAAQTFTFADDFAFYLTDVSADNVAVDMNGNAIFVDLENILVVDKNATTGICERTQQNMIEPICSDSFVFSPADICSHRLSDHNYYAICKLLWTPDECFGTSEGFLHDVPSDVAGQYPQLRNLLDACVLADGEKNRIQTGDELKELLVAIARNERAKEDL